MFDRACLHDEYDALLMVLHLLMVKSQHQNLVLLVAAVRRREGRGRRKISTHGWKRIPVHIPGRGVDLQIFRELRRQSFHQQ